jgi:hypothetical protein
VTFPFYFNPTFTPGYVTLTLESMRLTWLAQVYMKRKVLARPTYYAAHLVGALLDVLANVSPYFYPRLWAFWLGGFEEIRFSLRKRAG